MLLTPIRTGSRRVVAEHATVEHAVLGGRADDPDLGDQSGVCPRADLPDSSSIPRSPSATCGGRVPVLAGPDEHEADFGFGVVDEPYVFDGHIQLDAGSALLHLAHRRKQVRASLDRLTALSVAPTRRRPFRTIARSLLQPRTGPTGRRDEA